MSEDAEERLARARARSERITARVSRLGDEEQPRLEGTPESRIELVVELTRAAWALTGKSWPSLPRSRWPVRVRSLGESD